MKKKIFSVVATLLLSCYFAFAQNGGIPVELKPFNPLDVHNGGVIKIKNLSMENGSTLHVH